MVPLPPVPRWVPRFATVVWLALVVLGVALGHNNGFVARLAVTLLETAAPVAFAVAGLGFLVDRWQRREWERRTRYVVETLVTESLDALAGLAVMLYNVLVGALPARQRAQSPDFRLAFRLPLDEVQQETMLAAVAISKGVSWALAVVSQSSSSRANRASRTRHELWQAYMGALLRSQDSRLARAQGRIVPDDAETLAPEDAETPPPQDSDSDSASEQRPRTSFPEGEVPFSIEPSNDLVGNVIRGRAEISDTMAETVRHLNTLVIELSAYVPAQAEALVKSMVEIRAGARQMADSFTSGQSRVADADRENPDRGPAEPSDAALQALGHDLDKAAGAAHQAHLAAPSGG